MTETTGISTVDPPQYSHLEKLPSCLITKLEFSVTKHNSEPDWRSGKILGSQKLLSRI